MLRPVLVVVGAQFGSEAKGAVASYLGNQRRVKWAVRTGAVNAGHTVVYRGRKWVMQQLPCGWTNPRTQLVLGAGSFINREQLERETAMIGEATGESEGRVRDRIWIDVRAATHTEGHQRLAMASGRHWRMGATGKGCSEAMVDKIKNRGSGIGAGAADGGYRLFRETEGGAGGGWRMTDTARLLNSAYDAGEQILIEGTQGSLLDLHLGPYPFVTHKQTQAANWIGECGLSPGLEYEIVLVARTYPIRVAGNSGPMPGEMEWGELARRINRKLEAAGLPPRVSERALAEFEQAESWEAGRMGVNLAAGGAFSGWSERRRTEFREVVSEVPTRALRSLPEETQAELGKLFEFTTVTKKLRRVAELDLEGLGEAVRWNRPNYLVLTFLNYEFPELWDQPLPLPRLATVREVNRYLKRIEEGVWVPVRYFSTGAGEECLQERPPNLLIVGSEQVEGGGPRLLDDPDEVESDSEA